MAAHAPVKSVPLHHAAPRNSHSGPGEAALQRGADQILALIEQEKRNAERQRDAEILHLKNQLPAMHKDLQVLMYQKGTAQPQHTQLVDGERKRVVKDFAPSDTLPPTIDALLKKHDVLRAEYNASLSATQGAMEQLGIYNAGPGFYSFAAQWVDLFNELGIASGKPWRPEQLLAVIASTSERLRAHRGDLSRHEQPLNSNYDDAFVLESELDRVRRYVARLERKLAEAQSKQPTSAGPPIAALPTPPAPT